MGIVIEIVCWLITVGSIVSMFLFAAFDVQWWKPGEKGVLSAREFLLVLIHCYALVVGPVAYGIRRG